MGFLTDRAFITGITKSNLFHVVDVNDVSQGNPSGSSYKGSIEQLVILLNTEFVKITGDTITGPLSVTNLTVTGLTNTNVLSASTAYTETLVIENSPSPNLTDNSVLVRNTTTGEIENKDLTHYNFGFFVQTGDSTTVTNTIVETTILDGGIGTLSVPANGFSIGDSFHVKIGGTVSANNGETITIKIKSGSVILGTDTITFPNGVTSRAWEFTCDFTIIGLGGPGSGHLHSNGFFRFNSSTSDILGTGFSTSNNTTFNTTIPNTLDFTVQWGSASVSNSIYSSMCILNKLF